MTLFEFNEILNLSEMEIAKNIMQNRNELCLLRFKKITRQKFKSSDLKKMKYQIAKLQTVLTIRINQKL